MTKRLVRSLWLSSLLLGCCGSAVASGSAILAKPLEQRELNNPVRVATWLKENAAKADKVLARRFFDQALKDKARKAWGPAAKGFCESALFFPTPHALSECANAVAHSVGSTRSRENTYSQKSGEDVQHIQSLYRSAMAADVVLVVMTDKEKAQIHHHAECLAKFVQTRQMQANCQPLQAYGIKQ